MPESIKEVSEPDFTALQLRNTVTARNFIILVQKLYRAI